jgi:competence ComEA-like helix-hairpin-helix protein
VPELRRIARAACVAAAVLGAGARVEAGQGSGSGNGKAQAKAIDGVVNLNTAPAERLELLPGIGPAKVRSIVWYRQRHPFRTVDELVRIKGIGRKMVRKLRSHLAVSGPTTAQALRLARGAEPPPPEARPPPPPKPVAVAPPRSCLRTIAPAGPGRVARPAGVEARAPRSRANHCLRRP